MSRVTKSIKPAKRRTVKFSDSAGRGPTKYPGIGKDAEQLQVDRRHLWEVLEGNRVSRSLTAAYAALQAQKPKPQTTTE